MHMVESDDVAIIFCCELLLCMQHMLLFVHTTTNGDFQIVILLKKNLEYSVYMVNQKSVKNRIRSGSDLCTQV